MTGGPSFWRHTIKLPPGVQHLLYRLWPYTPTRLRRLVVLGMSEIFIVGVIAVVTDAHGRILLLEHSYRPEGRWGFPAGNVQRGERFESALRREFEEETGWTLGTVRLVAVYHWRRPPEVLLFYRGEVVAGEFRASPEITAAQFVAPDELLTAVGRPHRRLARVVLRLLGAEAAGQDAGARG